MPLAREDASFSRFLQLPSSVACMPPVTACSLPHEEHGPFPAQLCSMKGLSTPAWPLPLRYPFLCLPVS